MKSHWIMGLSMLAFAPAALAQTVYSTTVTRDPATGESIVSESATSYDSRAQLYVPSAPVEEQVYTEGVATGSGTVRNLAAETPGAYEREMESYNSMAPAARPAQRTGETNPADIAVNDDVLMERRAGEVAYITGGVGQAERAALDGMRGKYNFKLTNTETNGAFVSYTHLTLTDAKGAVVLNADSDPIFFAKLPAGKYNLRAEHEGRIQTKDFTVAKGKSSAVQLTW